MSGTKAGGIKARETNYKKHGDDFYKRIGKIGGQNGNTGGFAANPELAKTAGAKGGAKSRRSLAQKTIKIYEYMDANANEIITMRLLGATCMKIAKEYGLPYKAVCNWVSKREAVNE